MPTKMNNFEFKWLIVLCNLKIIREATIISLIQHFEADFHFESQPKNTEFRINPENFHPCKAR